MNCSSKLYTLMNDVKWDICISMFTDLAILAMMSHKILMVY